MQNIVLIGANVGNNRDMPQDTAKLSAQILVNIDPETDDRLLEIMDLEDRKKGYVARMLMLRGLACYEIDGKLKGGPPESTIPHAEITISRVESPKGKVAAHISGGKPMGTRRDAERLIAADAEILEKPKNRKTG